jgi:endoglycosylceramidase
MKFIRLHVAWEAVEAVKGQYNFEYLAQLKAIIRKAATYDITILLDAHQDVLSRFFCGEGFPDWAVSRSDYLFPFPLKKKLEVDEHGYPLVEECLKTKFFAYYFAFDTT